MTTLNLYHVDQITDNITIPANCLVINHIEKTAVYFVDSFSGTYEQGKSVGVGYALTDNVLGGNITLLVNIPTDGLVAEYLFEGDSTDTTNTHNGSDTNVSYAAGKYGSSATFDGLSSINTNSLYLTGQFSISYWCKLNTHRANGIMVGTINTATSWNGFVAK